MQESEGGTITRLHLRVERDGSGMLIANAAAAARLTSTGTLIVQGLLDGDDEATILQQLQANFGGAKEAVMRADIERVQALVDQILEPGDTYPVFNLAADPFSPESAELIAPLQATVPLAEPERMVPLLDRLWTIGIPHVTFLMSDASQSADLVRAVERAEDLGMIAGVRGRPADLTPHLSELVMVGVDHVTVPYASDDAATHDALLGPGDHAAATDLFTWLETNGVCAVAEVPLVEATLEALEPTVFSLLELGADNIVFVAYATADPALTEDGAFFADAMPQVANRVEEVAHSAQARFIWAPPVARDPAMPLQAQIRLGPRCVGDVAIRVEPDGSVIPPRGRYRTAGNILQDDWSAIWHHEAFRAYRERVEAPSRCDICPDLLICVAGCPSDPRSWAVNVAI
jgi:radical SAM protein with 4Fe4S-binding SPASM domain